MESKQGIDTLTARQKLPIGVFDSGVGGLTVLTVLKTIFPNEDFVYIGDSKDMPIGNRSNEEIISIAHSIMDTLLKVPVKMVVVACNTFSFIALDTLRQKYDVPMVGMCKGVHTAIDISPKKAIGIMATVATINSHKHKEMVQEIDDTVTVLEQPCPEFAHLIETGHINDSIIEEKVEEYMAPVLAAQVDTVVLACTHFPFIKRMLERITEHKVIYIDPAYETADEVKRVLQAKNLMNPKKQPGKLELCFTADIETANRLASWILPTDDFSIKEITL